MEYVYCDREGCKLDVCHFHCEELDFYGNPCKHIYLDYIEEFDGNGSLQRTYDVPKYHKHCDLCDETDEYHRHKPCYAKGCKDIYSHRHCKICLEKGLIKCERGFFHCSKCEVERFHVHCYECNEIFDRDYYRYQHAYEEHKR
jgi:hypothetical protein